MVHCCDYLAQFLKLLEKALRLLKATSYSADIGAAARLANRLTAWHK